MNEGKEDRWTAPQGIWEKREKVISMISVNEDKSRQRTSHRGEVGNQTTNLEQFGQRIHVSDCADLKVKSARLVFLLHFDPVSTVFLTSETATMHWLGIKELMKRASRDRSLF